MILILYIINEVTIQVLAINIIRNTQHAFIDTLNSHEIFRMALPEPSSNEDKKNKGIDQDDKDFDPTPEAFIDEIDDERTLEEEEAMDGNNGAAVQEELDDLKKESEMPIEELLAYYERMRNEAAQEEEESEEEELDEDEEDEENEDEDEHDDHSNDGPHRGGDGGSGKQSGHQSDNNQPSADSTSQQQSKTSDQKQSNINSDHKTNSSQHTISHQRTSYHNDDLVSSQAHSTTTSLEQNIEKPQSIIENQTDEGMVADSAATDGSNNETDPQQRHRRSMTDFVVTDESRDIFKSLLGYDLDDSDDMDEDYSYTDDEYGDTERDWRRSIHIGPEHQANIPENLTEYDDLPPYENEDKLVWKCNPTLTQERILEYLKQASALAKRNDISISPASVPKISNDNMRLYRERMQDITTSTGSHTIEHNHEKALIEHPQESLSDVYMSQSRKRVRIDYELEQENAMDGINQASGIAPSHVSSFREDNSDSISQDTRPEMSTEEYYQDEEQLLYLLLQCNYNFDEALRRRKLDPFKYYFHEPMSLWSQEECLGFEHGLRVHGKDFRSIRENRVQTRTHAEVVAFYYLWKKSERHDVYTNQYKLDRKRCLSHPGTTDYMDKFIEDNESILNASSSSPTPTPTPTESTFGVNSTADTTDEKNSTSMLYHSSETRPSIQYLPPIPTTQINHLQLLRTTIDDNPGQMSSPHIDSNTPL